MKKRFELSRFSPLEVSRRVQQCLRFEGVNTNGVAAANAIGVAADQNPEETLLSSPCCSEGKSNLLSTIKKKLKKTKRNKGRTPNVCQCENCETHSKHYRTRKHDKCSVWPISSSILRSQNHQQEDSKSDDVAELIPCDDSEPDCFSNSRQLPNSNLTFSLPNVSCDVSPSASLELDTETEDSAMQVYGTTTHEPILTMQVYGKTTHDPIYVNVEPSVPRVGNLTQELYKLSKYGWYWGPINRGEAEEKLVDQPDGAFLVRDSSDDRYILSLSFRSYGKTLHTRIEHSSGLFSFYAQPEPEGHASIVELIQQSMSYSQSGVFCYSRSRSPGSPSFPVRLTKPISRFTQVRSLQYLCRFVIRQFTRYDHIQKLPLPPRIKGYLEEGHY